MPLCTLSAYSHVFGSAVWLGQWMEREQGKGWQALHTDVRY